MAAAAVIQPATSLPRIKQLYTTPATPASSPQTHISLPSAAAAARRRYSQAKLQQLQQHGDADASSSSSSSSHPTITTTSSSSSSSAAATAATTTATATAVLGSEKVPYAPSKTSGRRRSGALSAAEALAKYRRVLTAHEQEEIRSFPSVWFVGATARKIATAKGEGQKSGFDDEKGRYKCVKNDHLAYRYEVLKGLGKGSFGDVVKAYDHKTKSYIAIKIIRNERRFHKQAQSEIKILDLIRRQDKKNNHNLIHMKDSFLFRGHLCITFEMMHCDLYAALKKNGFRGFGKSTLRAYAKSLVSSLRVLRRSRIIHCDLKPENILIRAPGCNDIKVIDFGSSCFDTQKVHTYIQSRFYRSPEVILGGEYGVPIDMWSFGCIMAELHSGRPIFPGRDEKEQLLYQMEVLGAPPTSVVQVCSRRASFFGKNCEPLFLNDKKGRTRLPGTRPLAKAVGSTDPVFLDFVARCLTWDPAARMTPREAAHHEFITGVKPTEDGYTAGTPVSRSRSSTSSSSSTFSTRKRDSRVDATAVKHAAATAGGSLSSSSVSAAAAAMQRARSDPAAPPIVSSAAGGRHHRASDSQLLGTKQTRMQAGDSDRDMKTRGIGVHHAPYATDA